ncbi:MAG: hypothetical protein AAFQ74_19710 [Cyanobacteria bacterium J06623_4]
MTNSPFHDPQQNPLPDANSIRPEIEPEADIDVPNDASEQDAQARRGPSSQTKEDIQRLRNAFIGLVIGGAVLGLIAAIGIIIFLKRAGFVDPPRNNPEVENFSTEALPGREL